MALYDDVYGLSYKTAEQKLAVLNDDLVQQAGHAFPDLDELKTWAHNHLLDKIVYSQMSHGFLCVSHKGELMTDHAFKKYYKDVLFTVRDYKVMPWCPNGFEYYSKAYVVSEQTDGVHKPLYYRDYFVPGGYYNEVLDAFNIAKPFPVFAKNTGRDTKFIYTYIEHIAGECAMWLLAWLRAKMLYPTVKTQVVPIIVSRAQGSGKTTFAEVICKGLFGDQNVLVTDQYDSQARFNADYADALIVCQEEKEETDKRNPAGALKSRATATTIRKELKGVDPIYQDSYTDFIMTTNKDVPIKFDGREDQRRFMIMEADEHFTRKESQLADEVFTKLYGYDANYNKTGTPFVEDKELIAQFKHELFSRQDIADVPLRNFPKTAAYKKCFTLPRTTENTEIESIVRALIPFIKETLKAEKLVTEVDGTKLSDVIQVKEAIQFMPQYKAFRKYVAVCRPLVFYEMGNMKPFPHAIVERGLYDCRPLLNTNGLDLLPDMDPVPGGFMGITGRYKMAPSARFVLLDGSDSRISQDLYKPPITPVVSIEPKVRLGERLRVNNYFKPDINGCFETVNEMKASVTSLTNKSKNVQYLDTFLFESDETSYLNTKLEEQRAHEWVQSEPIEASILYKERLATALVASMQLFSDNKVCRIVYSGAKSYHLLVRVARSPSTIQEYTWLHAYLALHLSDKLVFDSSTCDPARLTRSPIKLDRISEAYGIKVHGVQNLVCENWNNILNIDWEDQYAQWLDKPLSNIEVTKGKRLIPTKQIYRDAAAAILDTTFWTDKKWDGQRQVCFFAAYRILRLLGYTHNDLWPDIMVKGVTYYKHSNEIRYWQTRATSSLIASIDAEIDEFNSLIDGETNDR